MRPASTAPLGAVGLGVLGLVTQDIGASVAVLVFDEVGPAGMVFLRLLFSAGVLLAIARPKLRGIPRRSWIVVVLFGFSLGLMNLLFYQAIDRLDLGVTVTLEVIGPLILSVVLARRAVAWLWAVLAFGGVLLLGHGGFAELDPIGVLFAAGASAMWVAYILASRKTGSILPGLDGLAIAMAIGAVIAAPFGIAQAGPALLSPQILLIGLAVALLSSTIPYALELIALRRMAAEAFAVLVSASPAIAVGAGFFILGQEIGVVQAIGIVLVIVASIGAVRASPPPRERPQEPLAEPVA